jgi:hypothetical protein
MVMVNQIVVAKHRQQTRVGSRGRSRQHRDCPATRFDVMQTARLLNHSLARSARNLRNWSYRRSGLTLKTSQVKWHEEWQRDAA